MGFRKHRETDLERELRAQRPQPREQFVQMLSGKTGAKKSRSGAPGIVSPGRAAPRIALVAVVTVVLAASLGVAGALGHAGGSVKSFGTSVFHVIHTPTSTGLSSSFKSGDKGGKNDGKGDKGTGGDGDPGDDHDHDGHDPFHHEYHHFVPICYHLHIVFVPGVLYNDFINFGKTPLGAGTWTAPTGYHPLKCT